MGMKNLVGEGSWDKQSGCSKNTNTDSGLFDSQKRVQEKDKGGNMLDRQNWDCFELIEDDLS